ncbi:helix-turn-helix transcriptional regulator [Photorhabdus luminescens]|uniref:Helix-turn-helix transcriptional regulator n=2 Tax=Photorhabdus luminescens TaxID=29488 RepID=A0A4R4JCM3_PHOLU|nr:helix-turn-helix transcriptional regulator [Photorhabdus luminescens]TDB51436.1 helix-turn-helix transcriptional regulator [Photorhabdus luminescens subsp. mexicana]
MSQITPQLTNMWDKSHDSWFVKDKNLRFIYANKVFIRLGKLPENFDVIGYTAKELPTPFNYLANFFEKHDRKVLQSMQRISSIGADLQSNGQQLKPYFCEKYPLMDEDNQCIGVICRIKEISHFSIHNYIKHSPSISVRLRPPNNILTEKEWMVIFLFCQGVSNKSIADEMNVSCRILERYFKNIYEKLSIGSIIELKLFCEKNNYDLYIPPEYFKSMNHFLLY